MDRLAEDQSLLRNSHDPSRPAITASQASEFLQQSRFHVAELVKKGVLPGYGIPAEKRTRWYVYLDALATEGPHGDRSTHKEATQDVSKIEFWRSTVDALRHIRDQLGSIEKQRRESRKVLLNVYDAASYDQSETVQELLRTVNDSERRNFKFDDDLSDIREIVITLLDRLQHEGAE